MTITTTSTTAVEANPSSSEKAASAIAAASIGEWLVGRCHMFPTNFNMTNLLAFVEKLPMHSCIRSPCACIARQQTGLCCSEAGPGCSVWVWWYVDGGRGCQLTSPWDFLNCTSDPPDASTAHRF